MVILILFAFLAGIVTILSPCILPVLPFVLSGSFGGRLRPLGVVIGFVASFTFFTLLLSTIIKLTGLPSDLLRNIAITILIIFGAALLFPKTQGFLEQLFSQLGSGPLAFQQKRGFFGGILLGSSLGLVWAPCVGPILASVIALAATDAVTLQAFFIMLAYALGTAIPMFAVMIGGRALLTRLPFLTTRATLIQKLFGILMVLTACALVFGVDRQFQSWVLEKFPQYGAGLTQIEQQGIVLTTLDSLQLPAPDYGPAPDFIGATGWLNSEPLTVASLKGKVVLVDFWTYTCINCIRTFPFLRGLYEKYKDQGLVIVGIHSPEFEFEKKAENVQAAMKDYGLTYPVVQDNNFAIWKAYKNQYWPAGYFIDRNGHIRRVHIGEGGYEESEKFIQKLLAEDGTVISNDMLDIQETKIQTRTPETYLGYERIEFLASPENIQPDKTAEYTIPTTLAQNSFAYNGTWMIGSQYASPNVNAELEMLFESKDVYLVMRRRDIKKNAKVEIILDGRIVGSLGGTDLELNTGLIQVKEDRLYHLIHLDELGKHRLKLRFPDDNVELYAFTFG